MEELKDQESPTIFNKYVKAEAYTQYAIPTFKSSSDIKYVKWVDNDGKRWPDKLLEYKNNCTLHNSLTISAIQQICGAGFVYDTSSLKSAATEKFLNTVNKDGDNVYQVYCKFVEDEYINGLASILLNYELNKSSIPTIEHVYIGRLSAAPLSKDSSSLEIPGWWWTWDWSNISDEKMVFIPSNNFKSTKSIADEYNDLVNGLVDKPVDNLERIKQIFNSDSSRILVHQPTRDTLSYYYRSLPCYAAGINSIRVDINIDRYNLNAIEHGLNIDSLIQVVGINTDEGKDKFANEWNLQYRNLNRGKQSLIAFPIDKDHMLQIDELNTNQEATLYTKISSQVETKILQAHRVSSPLLAGVKTQGQLGASTEYEDAAKYYYENVIKRFQYVMLEPFNEIMKYNNLETLSIKRLNEDVQTTEVTETNADIKAKKETLWNKLFK